MAPTFVFEDSKKLVLRTGSHGGSALINYVGKVLVGTMDWSLSVQQAISLPNFGRRSSLTELEQGIRRLVAALKEQGHNARMMD